VRFRALAVLSDSAGDVGQDEWRILQRLRGYSGQANHDFGNATKNAAILHLVSRREYLCRLGGALAACCRLGRAWSVSAQEPKERARLELPCKLLKPTAGVEHVAVAPGSRWLVGGGKETAWLWDLKADAPAARSIELRGSAGPISPDGRWLVSLATDRTARLWDLKAARK
jgi:WD domain, G-beta repeat